MDQGYTNYETRSVGIWLDNDYGLYMYWQGRGHFLRDVSEDNDDGCDVVGTLAKELEAGITAGVGAGSDLTVAELKKVNWQELAKDILS